MFWKHTQFGGRRQFQVGNLGKRTEKQKDVEDAPGPEGQISVEQAEERSGEWET